MGVKTTVVVMKGIAGADGNLTRVQLMNIVLRFIAKVYPRSELLSDRACVILNIPTGEVGDYRWCLDNVMNRAYLDSVYADEEAEAKAVKLYEAYKACEDREGKVGIGLIRYYMQTTYLQDEGMASMFVR